MRVGFALRSAEIKPTFQRFVIFFFAILAQLGERKTEDLEALCSIHSQSKSLLHP